MQHVLNNYVLLNFHAKAIEAMKVNTEQNRAAVKNVNPQAVNLWGKQTFLKSQSKREDVRNKSYKKVIHTALSRMQNKPAM